MYDMVKHTDYNWRGDDGSVVLLPKFLLVIILVEIYLKMIKQVMSFGKKNVLKKQVAVVLQNIFTFLNGFDQAPIRKNLPDLIKKRNEKDPDNEYIISCVEDYIKDVKK